MTDFSVRRLNILYETLRDIRRSINQIARFREPYVFSYDQRFMIDLYTSMYNSTLRQIDYLHQDINSYVYTPTENANRVYINGRPYIIESVENVFRSSNNVQQRVPRNGVSSSYTTSRQNLFSQPTSSSADLSSASSSSSSSSYSLNGLLTEALRQFYNPVVVRPSTTQIAVACRQVTFGSITNPLNTSCPISLDVFQPDSQVMQIIHCGHAFVPIELSSWFQHNTHCPICRFDIRNHPNNGLNSGSTRSPTRTRTTTTAATTTTNAGTAATTNATTTTTTSNPSSTEPEPEPEPRRPINTHTRFLDNDISDFNIISNMLQMVDGSYNTITFDINYPPR